ncbi:ADP-ribosylglycohydrolase family protein [Planosporangium thailandense]|uniref:ADP-ribosylglycohydrolase family protein n=1 Tax=Planosporangium thailandense TaxID=765197 RepID=A0ABX0XRL4_9ACTN|nr:ADP-ribosylglycohydrolase family protein [Planosporangium thailandense]
MTDRYDRALGALTGLALGDALGMPTQLLSRPLIRARYGELTWFLDAPDDNEISRGTPAGRVTDDTDQALILGRLLVAGGGRVDPRRLADELLSWEARMTALGSADLLGPSTRRALQLLAQGAPIGEAGRWGDTNGAAMRVAPVGVVYPPDPVDRLVDAVADVDRVTHDTTVANAGAAAVAAAVSAGIDGASLSEAVTHGIEAARVGATRGQYVPGADVAARIEWARDLAAASPEPLDVIYRLVGTGVATQEAVPAAFAVLAVCPADPFQACLAAASLGGDCDTVAAMVGAISGACHGYAALPPDAVATLNAANPTLNIPELAGQLLELRDRLESRS